MYSQLHRMALGPPGRAIEGLRVRGKAARAITHRSPCRPGIQHAGQRAPFDYPPLRAPHRAGRVVGVFRLRRGPF